MISFFYVYQSRQLESETGTTEEHSLNKEARKWATRVAREHKNIIHYKRVRWKRNQHSHSCKFEHNLHIFLKSGYVFVPFTVFGGV